MTYFLAGRIFTLTGAENIQLEMERLMDQCHVASVAIDDKVKEQKDSWAVAEGMLLDA